MDMSSPSKLRLPHASAGPFWCPPPVLPRNEWREIEAHLSAPFEPEYAPARRGIGSFAFVTAALMIGGGVLGWTLIGSRSDCGATCHVVTAVAGPTGKAAPGAVTPIGLASRSDPAMTEGRSVAEPPSGAAAMPEAAAPSWKHRRHRHRHHVDGF